MLGNKPCHSWIFSGFPQKISLLLLLRPFFPVLPILRGKSGNDDSNTTGGLSMKFSCEKALLQNAILTASRAV
ncbi:MAG: hypothetical protein ACLRWL_06995, partial [Evtepia gabavorous]